MKKNRSSAGKRKLNRIIMVLSLAVVLCIVLYAAVSANSSAVSEPPVSTDAVSANQLSVMIIDVGQGDSVLVTFGSEDTMLIDAGEPDDTQAIKEELDERGITQIDVLVATHPHADHIGSMAEIINSYDIGSVYMPDMQSKSKTYRTLKDTIEKRGIPLTIAYAGEAFSLGLADCTIVSPEKSADKDANNESVMLLVDYLDTEFLFTGDAEKWAESKVLDAGYNIDADVLKVGHHGSNTSTSKAFLNAVSPDYAVISCGKNNDYGHPHKVTLDLLDEYGIDTLRTDVSGDVLFISDGYTLKTVLGD